MKLTTWKDKVKMTTRTKNKFRILQEKVVEASHDTEDIGGSLQEKWEHVKHEWTLWKHEESNDRQGICTCTQEHLYHLYTIRNMYNYNQLVVGSRCIRRFEQQDMTEDIHVVEMWQSHRVRYTQYEGMTFLEAISRPSFPSWIRAMESGRYFSNKKNTLDLIRFYKVWCRLH